MDSTIIFVPCGPCGGKMAVTVAAARTRKALKCPYCAEMTDLTAAATAQLVANAASRAAAKSPD